MYLTLLEVPQIGSETLRKLISKFKTPKNILFKSSQEDFDSINRISKDLFNRIQLAKKRLDHNKFIYECLNKRGIRIIFSTDSDYPKSLRLLKIPPFLLFVWGNIPSNFENTIAIIGSRTPSKKGIEIAYKSAYKLSKKDYTIISGYADGIDIAAHLGSLKAKGKTVFILPFGILNFRLKNGIKSMDDILEKGAIISEVHPKAPWQVGYAHNRNRLIVALSKKVFIVETRLKSGSMNTFQTAKKLNREIFTAKYEKYPNSAKGNKSLIAQGVTPITSYKNISIITK